MQGKPTSVGFGGGANRNAAVPELTVVVRQGVTGTAFFDLFRGGGVRLPSVLLIILKALTNLTKNNA